MKLKNVLPSIHKVNYKKKLNILYHVNYEKKLNFVAIHSPATNTNN